MLRLLLLMSTFELRQAVLRAESESELEALLPAVQEQLATEERRDVLDSAELLGRRLREEGAPGAALEVWAWVAREWPEQELASRIQSATCRDAMGQPDAARTLLHEVLLEADRRGLTANDPDRQFALRVLGPFEEAQARPEAALAAYRDWKYPRTWIGCGLALQEYRTGRDVGAGRSLVAMGDRVGALKEIRFSLTRPLPPMVTFFEELAAGWPQEELQTAMENHRDSWVGSLLRIVEARQNADVEFLQRQGEYERLRKALLRRMAGPTGPQDE